MNDRTSGRKGYARAFLVGAALSWVVAVPAFTLLSILLDALSGRAWTAGHGESGALGLAFALVVGYLVTFPGSFVLGGALGCGALAMEGRGWPIRQRRAMVVVLSGSLGGLHGLYFGRVLAEMTIPILAVPVGSLCGLIVASVIWASRGSHAKLRNS